MLRDLTTQEAASFLLAPGAYDADDTSDALAMDRAAACSIHICVGAGGITFSGTNKVEFKLQHSLNGSDWTAVTAEHVRGVASVGAGGIVRALTAAHATPSVTSLGYIGAQPFVRMFTDFSGTHGSPTPMAVLAVRGLLLDIAP